jgi:hypothetical protein
MYIKRSITKKEETKIIMNFKQIFDRIKSDDLVFVVVVVPFNKELLL